MMARSEYLLDIQDLSEYLNIKAKTLYSRIKGIPHYKVGRLIRFRREDVDTWMQQHRVSNMEVQDYKEEQESATPATEPSLETIRARKTRKRRGPITEVDRMISRAIDQVKGEGYTASHGKSDQVKGSGKEV
jgi:excisionase family DNA binding protein